MRKVPIGIFGALVFISPLTCYTRQNVSQGSKFFTKSHSNNRLKNASRKEWDKEIEEATVLYFYAIAQYSVL